MEADAISFLFVIELLCFFFIKKTNGGGDLSS